MMMRPSTSTARVGGLGHVFWPHLMLNVGQPQRLSPSSTSARVFLQSRAATLPHCLPLNIKFSKCNRMPPDAEWVNMDYKGLPKSRKALVTH